MKMVATHSAITSTSNTLLRRITSLHGKVALVTGAGSGIGAGIAIHLASLGVSVVLAGRTESKLQSTYEQIVKSGGHAAISVGDAATIEGNKKFVDDALSKFGQLNIAINNAGVYRKGKLVDVTPDQISELFGTNVNSIIYGLKYQLPAIGKSSTAQDQGVIINVSSFLSTTVRRGIMSNGVTVYQTTKAAVDMLTRISALEAAEYNTRVVAVNPPYVHTEMTASQADRDTVNAIQKMVSLQDKAAEADDVADMVTYLLTAPYTNANTFSLDAGANVV